MSSSIPKPKVFSLSNIASMISSNLDEHQTEPIESEMPLHSIRSAVVNALSVNMDPFLQLLYLPSSSFSSSSAWNPAEKSPISTTSLLLGLDVLNEFIEFGTEIMVDEMGAIDKYLAFEDGRLNFNGQGVMGSNTTNHLGMMVLEAECISKIPFYRLFCWIFGAYR